jgi:hypothetical protein
MTETNMTGVLYAQAKRSRIRSKYAVTLSTYYLLPASGPILSLPSNVHADSGRTVLLRILRNRGGAFRRTAPAAIDTDYWAGRTVDRNKSLGTEQVTEAVVSVAIRPLAMAIDDVTLEYFPQKDQ